LGSYGAYVCGSSETIELLVNSARPFIFSTAPPPPPVGAPAGRPPPLPPAPPPPPVGAAAAALELLTSRPDRVERLARNAEVLRAELRAGGLDPVESRTQILPIVVREPRHATALCELALERGVFAQAIRPPTVPAGTSRLRLAVMATHREAELRHAARVLAGSARELGVGGGGGARPGGWPHAR